MTLLQAVTRILRLNAVLRGDTDPPASFADTNHNASMQLAIVAVQDELTAMAADRLLPYEKTSATINLASGTRAYTLASDFVNFYGFPHFYDATDNRIIPEWKGGQEQLQLTDFQYLTRTGTPTWWYWEPAATKRVGFYQIPNASYDGRALTYHYEKSVMVSIATDNLPFHNDEESNTFSLMAGRRFKFMYEDVDNKADIQQILENDVSYRQARTTLIRLVRGTNAPGYWAHSFR